MRHEFFYKINIFYRKENSEKDISLTSAALPVTVRVSFVPASIVVWFPPVAMRDAFVCVRVSWTIDFAFHIDFWEQFCWQRARRSDILRAWKIQRAPPQECCFLPGGEEASELGMFHGERKQLWNGAILVSFVFDFALGWGGATEQQGVYKFDCLGRRPGLAIK